MSKLTQAESIAKLREAAARIQLPPLRPHRGPSVAQILKDAREAVERMKNQ